MPLTLRNFNKRPQPITVPGIYHNSRTGVISLSSDGTNWITIADKNLGATQVYNDGDTLSQANCGNYYQWGNNYGFPFTGAVTTSSTQVDTTGYGPGNYYSSSTFIEGSFDWSSVQNDDLWGGETGTVEAMQGPTSAGFHVPTKDENVALVAAMTTLGIDTSNGNCMKTYLKMPFAGYRSLTGAGVHYQGTYGRYWSANAYINVTSYAYNLYFDSFIPDPQNGNYRANGYSIRPFVNTPVQPDDSGEWEELYVDREYIEYKTITGADSLVWIEGYGIGNTGEKNCSFDWYVSVNGGVEVHVAGTGPTGGNISGPRSYNEEVTVRIRPATRTYGWARAFGWYGNPHNSITEVIFDGSYMGYADSATDTGNYFRSNQYNGCAMLRNAPEEYLPDTVTTIGTHFRNQQFYGCSILPYAPVESLPNNVSSIGGSFRNGQYGNCTGLTQIRGWKDINLTVSTYRVDQFAGCTSNKIVKVLSDAMASSSADTLDNDYVTQVKVPATYLNNFKNFNDAPRSLISDSKFVGY